VILSLKGTHNVELLVQGKKKVIVNVDLIKPYRIPDVLPSPESSPENKVKIPPTPNAVYEFDGKKFVPFQDTDNPEPEAKTPEPDDPATIPVN
jgi:hypothetical protein